MNFSTKKTWTVFVVSSFFPVLVFAIAGTDITDVASFIDKIRETIGLLFLPLLGAMSVMFLYSVFKFMTMGQGDESKRNDARKMMMWALVGFFAVVAIYGIVEFLQDFFTVSGGGQIPNANDLPGRPH